MKICLLVVTKEKAEVLCHWNQHFSGPPSFYSFNKACIRQTPSNVSLKILKRILRLMFVLPQGLMEGKESSTLLPATSPVPTKGLVLQCQRGAHRIWNFDIAWWVVAGGL